MNKNNVVQMVDTLEMVGFLKTNGTQCRFVSLVCKTPVVKIKVNNPFGKVFKVASKIGIINANFNTSVRKRIAEKLGVVLSDVQYTNGKTWFEHVLTPEGKPLPLVQHKDERKRNGKYYIQYFPHKSTHRYVNANGEPLTDAQVEPYLYKESERSEFKPCVIALDLANVCQLKASGVVIEMPDFAEAEAVLA